MDVSRSMSPEEERAIEEIAGVIYDDMVRRRDDTTSGTELNSPRRMFVEGFKSGRVYTINQFEDFTEQFERGD